MKVKQILIKEIEKILGAKEEDLYISMELRRFNANGKIIIPIEDARLNSMKF